MKDTFEIRLADIAAGAEPRCNQDVVSGGGELAPIMSAICRWLARYELVRFEVSGFGQEKWPVDVSVDLAVVAEQIPGVLQGLLEQREVELDFYEQGIQRLLTFERATDDEVTVSCRSGVTGWEPVPQEYVVGRRDVIEMLWRFGQRFADIARAECPGPTSQAPFRVWLAELGAATCALHSASP